MARIGAGRASHRGSEMQSPDANGRHYSSQAGRPAARLPAPVGGAPRADTGRNHYSALCRSSTSALRKRAASPPVTARWSTVSDTGSTGCIAGCPSQATT